MVGGETKRFILHGRADEREDGGREKVDTAVDQVRDVGLGLFDVMTDLGGFRVGYDACEAGLGLVEADMFLPVLGLNTQYFANSHPKFLAASSPTLVPRRTASASLSSNTSSISFKGKLQHTSAFNTNSLFGFPAMMASLK